MLRIRAARAGEFDAVRAFYHSLIDDMQDSPYLPGWEKDIYPANDYLRNCLARSELYIGEIKNEITAAMVVNGDCNEGYAGTRWPTEAEPGAVRVIHILGVHPRFAGRGYARQLVPMPSIWRGNRAARRFAWTF